MSTPSLHLAGTGTVTTTSSVRGHSDAADYLGLRRDNRQLKAQLAKLFNFLGKNYPEALHRFTLETEFILPLKIHAAPLSTFGVRNTETRTPAAASLPAHASSAPLVAASSDPGAPNVGHNAPIVRVVSDDSARTTDYQRSPRVNNSRHHEVSNSLPLHEHLGSNGTPTSTNDTPSTETVPVALNLGHDQPCASQLGSPPSVDSALVPTYSSDPEDELDELETDDENENGISSKTPSGGIIAQSTILRKRSRDAMEQQTGDEAIPDAGALVADKKNVVSPNKRAKIQMESDI